ncbi:glycoside hydrolase [Peziza echinospora]|nr:glycoside hydrolase [Peziza echinospora]
MHFNALALALVAASCFVGETLAHYRFTKLIANGATQAEWKYIRQYDNINSRGPVTNVLSNDIRCNLGGSSTGGVVDVLDVSAGTTVGFVADAVVGHPGPFNAYLGKAPSDVKTWDGSGANWFRIWQKGTTSITSSGMTWDDTSSQWTFTIPKSTPNGQYLLRFEHIALHSAGSANGAQFYISCAQIKIINGGSGNPSPKVSLPGAYTPTQNNIMINIYYPVPTSYTVPGPAIWQG